GRPEASRAFPSPDDCARLCAAVLSRMTKSDIVQSIYMKLGGFSKKESADLVDLVFETIKETLGRAERVKISGFGNFVLRDKRSRQGRNPQTGEPIVIGGRRVLSFKASQVLKHAINEGADNGAAGGTSPARMVSHAAGARSESVGTAVKE